MQHRDVAARERLMPRHCVTTSETLRSIAALYYDTVDAASALASSNRLSVSAPLEPGTQLMLPARLLGFGGLSERTAMQAVVNTLLYERRKDLVFVTVQENVYPDDMVAISGKWLYVVSEGAIVVRAQARAADDWEVENQLFGGKRKVVDSTLTLVAGRSYSFFLAPFPLSPKAEQYLLNHVSECITATHLDALIRDAVTFVRDAYLWSLDLQHKLYVPALRTWQEWVLQEEQATKLFIASSLHCMIAQKAEGMLYDDSDPLDIADQLQPGEPKRYLEQVYQKNELAQRSKAERAMALLADMIDSFDFRTLERSAMEVGGEQLAVSFMIWAGVLENAIETHPGRELTRQLIGDDSRIPVAYLLSDAPPANSPRFGEARYVLNAGLAILKDLAPAWVAHHTATHSVDRLRHLSRYLEQLSEQAPLVGDYSKMHDSVQQGRPLTRNLPKPQKTFQRLVVESKLADVEAAAMPPRWLLESERLTDAYVRNFQAAHTTVRAAVEAINLGNAVVEWISDSSGRKLMSAIGAGADFGAMVAESAEVFVAESSKRAIKSAAAGLGIVSGICDYVEFVTSSHEAVGKRDFNQAVGLAVAAAGAGMLTIGSAVSLVSAVGAGVEATAAGTSIAAGMAAGLSAGGLMGIIGAALVGAGALAARLCTDNSYEEFAKVCFLGKEHDMEPTLWSWTSAKVPTLELRDELTALLQLISVFRISLEDDDGLTIIPGFTRPGDVFEVYLEQRYQTHEPHAARLYVDPTRGEIRQLRGLQRKSSPVPLLH